MNTKSLVDELSEDREQDEKIVKSFYSKNSLSLDIFKKINDSYKMKESIRNRLLMISNDFIEFLGIDFFIHDVVLTGSLSNYNWSEFSDIDMHIIIDYDESEHNNKLLQEFFNAKKGLWNDSHDIKIKKYDVEVYVQDIKEKHVSSGVYSILNDKWVIKPQKEKKYIDDNKILEKGEEFSKLIDDVIKKNNEGIDVSIKIDKIKQKIKRFRQSGLSRGGEYSYENLVFKLLRRNDYIKKLIDLKKKVNNNKLSIV